MLKYDFFPNPFQREEQLESILQCFARVEDIIDSEKNNWRSNEVLRLLRPHLLEAGMQVEQGKKKKDKIRIPVLVGLSSDEREKYFEPDALSKDGKIVLEIEAGRSVDNNQFLKDIFKACMILEVEYLIMAVRNKYRRKNDFHIICGYLKTLYASKRITLALKGIIIVGY